MHNAAQSGSSSEVIDAILDLIPLLHCYIFFFEKEDEQSRSYKTCDLAIHSVSGYFAANSITHKDISDWVAHQKSRGRTPVSVEQMYSCLQEILSVIIPCTLLRVDNMNLMTGLPPILTEIQAKYLRLGVGSLAHLPVMLDLVRLKLTFQFKVNRPWYT